MADGAGYVDLRRFGGLQFSTDPGDVGLERAIAGENFMLARDGSFVRSRDGITRLSAVGGLSGISTRLTPDPDLPTSRMLSVGNDGVSTTYLDYVTSVGGVVAIGNWASASPLSFNEAITFGTPTANMAFVSTEGVLMRKYTGGVLSASVGKPKYLAVTPASNRLIQGFFRAAADSPSGANGSRSTVFFSDPGLPETFTATNYVHLHPGDGEELRGIVSFRNQTFMLKETKLFIFYGEGVGPVGLPEFLWRVERIPGLRVAIDAGPRIAATANWVYILTTDGVYRTAGSGFEKASGPLDELFRLGTISPRYAAIWTIGNSRILLFDANAAYVYVFDDLSKEWIRWRNTTLWPATPGSRVPPFTAWPGAGLGGTEGTMFAQGQTVYYTDSAATADDGSALASSYQSGFGDLGSPTPKVVGPSVLWGTGTLTYAMATDYGTADAGTSLALGTAPTADDKHERRTRRGTKFSYKVSAASGAWRLNNVGLYVRSVRTGGIKL